MHPPRSAFAQGKVRDGESPFTAEICETTRESHFLKSNQQHLGKKNKNRENGVRIDIPPEFPKGKRKSVPTQRLQQPYKYLNVPIWNNFTGAHPPRMPDPGDKGVPHQDGDPFPHGTSPPEVFRLLHHESRSTFFPQPPGGTSQTISHGAVRHIPATPGRGTAPRHRATSPLLQPPTASGRRGTDKLEKENKSPDNSGSPKGDFRGVIRAL